MTTDGNGENGYYRGPINKREFNDNKLLMLNSSPKIEEVARSAGGV